MAGVKGRSGGARPGAGRPKKEPTILQLAATYSDPLPFLMAVVNDQGTDIKIRVDAAKAALPYKHAKPGEVGKKDLARDRAAAIGGGRFAPSAPPPLKPGLQ